MKNNDKNNLNDKDLENISGGDIGNKEQFDKEKIQEMFKNRDWRPALAAYGGPDPRSWEGYRKRMEEEKKKQDKKEGVEPLLPATPEKEDK